MDIRIRKYMALLLMIVILLLADACLFGSAYVVLCASEKNDAAFDLGAPPKTRNRLTPDLSFGGSIALEYELERNFDLNTKNPDDLVVWEPSLSMVFSYTPTDESTVFLNVESSRRIVDDEKNRKNSETELELKQAFFLWKEMIDGLDLKIGRQRFKDKREWLYDEELNGIRLFYGFSSVAFDISVSEKNDEHLLTHGNDERVTNYMLYGSYVPCKNTVIAAYSFVRDDRASTKESPIFYGVHLSGEVIDNLEYWLELAHVRGRSGSKKIRGVGFDFGSTYELALPLKPSITLGFAFGSGDSEPSDDKDTNFRQTGLQDNNAKFNGVTCLKYYGEMFNPELSNLGIFTAGLGIRPTRKTSVDVVYHYYCQHETSNEIRDSELNKNPNGLSRKLGKEIDLVAGYRSKRHVKTGLSIGYFMPGKAFPHEADEAFFVEIKIRYDF